MFEVMASEGNPDLKKAMTETELLPIILSATKDKDRTFVNSVLNIVQYSLKENGNSIYFFDAEETSPNLKLWL